MRVWSIQRLLFFNILLSLVQCVIIDTVYDTTSKYIAVTGNTGFGFFQGGTLQVSIQKEANNGAEQWFLLCTPTEITNLFNFNADACNVLNNSTCTLSIPFHTNITITDFIIPEYGVYYLELFNCDKFQFKAKAHIILLNPDEDHLSFAYIPLPSLFIILLFIWTFVTFVWCFNWIKFRIHMCKLNLLMTIYPVVKLLYSGMATFYWETYSVDGDVSNSLDYFFIFFIILEEAVLYVVLLLTACGWGLNKEKLEADKYLIMGVLCALAITRILGYLVHQLFFLLSFLTYIIIVVTIFRFVNTNLRDLHIELRDNPRPIDPTARNPTIEQEKMLKSFKIIMLSYIALVMMNALFQLLFLRDYQWVTDMMKELLELLVFISVIWTFRLRSLNVYYALEDEEESAFYRDNSGVVNLQPTMPSLN